MSPAAELVTEAYRLAKKSDHKALRPLIADDATWRPAPKAKWKPCSDGDQIVRTLLWRTSRANKMRPGEMIELGSFVIFRVRGARLERLGARGLLVPKLFQVVEVRGGKIVRMHEHTKLEEALAATGHSG
jgi:ketosteroid isomerase-like protein